MSPRWYRRTEAAAKPGARHGRRAYRASLVNGAGGQSRHRLHQGDRPQRQDLSAQTALKPEVEFEWKIPKWSNTIERDRARTYFQAYAAAAALYFAEQALAGAARWTHQDLVGI